MINPKIPLNVSFRVESMYTKNGGRVGVIKPNAQGIYCGLPMMVLGQVTQQQTYYDPQSMVDQITNPNSRYSTVLRQGKSYGEWGHPSFIGMPQSDQLQRLVTVDEKHTSHLFTSVYTDNPSADGTIVVRADIKPSGPMGPVLKESLDDPVINTAFSLRAYVDTKVNAQGVKMRTVRSLVTFDTVGASGFYGTDKAHAIGLESFAGSNFLDYEINVMQDGNLMIDQVALETYNNTDLNEIFGTSDIQRIVQSRTFVKVDPSLAERFPTLYQKGIFHDYFKEQ